MKLLIEGYPYPIGLLQELFPNVDELDVVNGVASVNYVGYYYLHPRARQYSSFQRLFLISRIRFSIIITLKI